MLLMGGVTQRVERLTRNRSVVGSNLHQRFCFCFLIVCFFQKQFGRILIMNKTVHNRCCHFSIFFSILFQRISSNLLRLKIFFQIVCIDLCHCKLYGSPFCVHFRIIKTIQIAAFDTSPFIRSIKQHLHLNQLSSRSAVMKPKPAELQIYCACWMCPVSNSVGQCLVSI